MKKMTGFLAVLIMLMAANTIRADANGLVNGSFEYDTWIGDISTKEPNGWDVNMPADKFGGFVSNEWATEGNFSLTLYSFWYTAFEANDMAEVFQQVPLKDVESISFDIKLDTYPSGKIWNPNKRTAAVLVDDKIVWGFGYIRQRCEGRTYKPVREYKYNRQRPSQIVAGPYIRCCRGLAGCGHRVLCLLG